MQRRSFSREFKVEAVRLVRERGVPAANGRARGDMQHGRSGNVWNNAAMESF